MDHNRIHAAARYWRVFRNGPNAWYWAMKKRWKVFSHRLRQSPLARPIIALCGLDRSYSQYGEERVLAALFAPRVRVLCKRGGPTTVCAAATAAFSWIGAFADS